MTTANTMPKPTVDTANEIIALGQTHLKTLIGRQWPDLSRILEKEEEVTINAKIVVTMRTPTPGEHGDKDNSLKTTISFAEKFSASIDAALSDPSQPELNLNRPAGDEPAPENPSKAQFFAELTEKIGALMPGGVYQAITGRFSGDDQVEIGRTFKKAAKAIGWPQEAIDLVITTAKAAGSITGFLEIVNSQTQPALEKTASGDEADANQAQ